MGWGAIRQVCWRDTIGGFVTLHVLEHGLFPVGMRIAECGTYLLPEMRRRGLNPRVKWETVRLACGDFAVDWCVFVVLSQNQQAIRGLNKLAWPFVMTVARPDVNAVQANRSNTPHEHPMTTSDGLVHTASSPLWTRFARWQAWKTQQEVVVFALHRDSLPQLTPPPFPAEEDHRNPLSLFCPQL